MKLWLLRHGDAERLAPSDAERPLSCHGREGVLQVAGRLAGRPLRTILASPYRRAWQTATLVQDALEGRPELVVADWLTPEGDLQRALGQLAVRDEDELLLVSHQPLVGLLAGMLVHGHRQSPVPMATANLAELDGEMPLAGVMTLCALHCPVLG